MSDDLQDARDPNAPARWTGSKPMPANVQIGNGTLLSGDVTFRRFRSSRDPALVLGRGCTMDSVQFAIGRDAWISVGDECFFTNAILLAEMEIRIGRQVMIGWNAVIADTDFHPIAPAERIADAIACSPAAQRAPRPLVQCKPVIIGDRVYIGPAATILKGVRIGDDAWIEPGAMVTRDVPAGARMLGNPARNIAEGEARS